MKYQQLRLAAAAAAATCMFLGSGATAAPKSPTGAKCGRTSHPGGEWSLYGKSVESSRTQNDEFVIGVDNVDQLAPAWTFSATASGAAGDFVGTPIVDDGCLFAGSSAGWMVALNADTGALVWKKNVGAAIPSTLASDGKRVFAAVNKETAPYVVALDAETGAVAWRTVVDEGAGVTAYSSPVIYRGMVLVGISAAGAGAGGPATSGKLVFLDASSGRILEKMYTIPPALWKEGYGGGGIWGTPAIDPRTGYAYVGAGNPNSSDLRHPHTNALLKIDVYRSRRTFGEVVASFRGDLYENLPTYPYSPDPHFEHMDFGATANVMRIDGETFVGAMQGSAVFYAVDPDKMLSRWRTVLGTLSPTGNASSSAFDGERIYASPNPGMIYGLGPKDGTPEWISPPTGDGPARYQPLTAANGVVYTIDLKGVLGAYDAATGIPLTQVPLAGGATGTGPASSLGGVSVARNTIYAAVGLGLAPEPQGQIVALRLSD